MAIEPVTCSCPPELTEDELEAALQGVEDAAVKAHLVRCPYCSARLRAMQRFECTLQVRLSRQSCPDVSILGDYALGLLGTVDAQRLREHIETCAACTEELRIIRDSLRDPLLAVPEEINESTSIADSLGRLVDNLQRRIASLLLPGPRVALRGGDHIQRIVAATPNERVVLEKTTQGERWRLAGQVLSQDYAVWNGALVEIHQGDELAAVAILDDMNEFTCDGLTAARMRVMITAVDGKQIVVPDLHFGTNL